MSYPPIENYGIIGDLRTVALVGSDGAIDLLCLPHFDSPSVFLALLDRERGGSFRLAPVLEGARARQLYLPDTAVLLTRFLSDEGVAEVSDFMPVSRGEHVHDLVRRAKTVRGEIPYRMVCEPRFDYARADHAVEKEGPRKVLFRSRGEDRMALRLRSSVPLRVRGGTAVAEFTLGAGETAFFVLEEVERGRPSPWDRPEHVSATFKETVNFWRGWRAASRYEGRWREMVHRSAVTLKLLTSAPYGSIVAAPTFGLPEAIGGGRNWDYRYVWIRDASFTLYALLRLGFVEEASAFMRWIEARCAELDDGGALSVLYAIDGRAEIPEEDLEHLEGYMGSRPVRIGNAAADQLQLDIYGELLDSIYIYDRYGEPISHDLWMKLVPLVDWVGKNWRKRDHGIWEVRGGRREFLYSRVLCWVAIDRAIRIALRRSFPAPVDRWLKTRDAIYRDVYGSFWDQKRGAFVQSKGAEALDAAALLLPLVKFVSPIDPRWLSTLRAIEGELVDDSLVYRYLPDRAAPDGLHGEEGTFSMCSFWYVECVARSGDVEKARFLFEKMLGYANHLGLYGEELSRSGRHLGNFPQAFTHLALISAAVNLDRALGGKGTAGRSL